MVTVSPHVGGLAPTIGRSGELHDLRLAFQQAPVQVLTGMGGVGKTSLARAYAQQHLDTYTLIWWIRAEDPASIDAEFRSLLEVLLPPGEATQIADARTKAFDLLAHHPGPWLLVLDNVPGAASANGLIPPIGNGHVLITSRASDWPTSSPVQPLTRDAAIELLTSQSGDADAETAASLATELGGLPLALAQAAAFTRANRIDLASYLRLYRDRSAELLEEGRPPDYPHTVVTTWQLALDKISDNARAVLSLLAFYSPDAVPVHLIFAAADELALRRAIAELHAYSLITPIDADTVTVHRLVQVVTRNRLQVELIAHEWAEEACRLIRAAIPEKPVTATSLAVWNALRSHVQVLLDHLAPEHPATLAVRECQAEWIGLAGDAAGARDRYAELLQIQERVLGAEHARTLAAQHELATWVGEAGNATAARDLLARLNPVAERVLGVEHPDTLISRVALARWTAEAGDATRAREQCAELIPIVERVFGIEDPITLSARHNLCYLIAETGDAAAARDLIADVLRIRKRVLGVEHPDTLAAGAVMALWTAAAGDAARARELAAEQLKVEERVLGAEHPHTLVHRSNVAHWTGEAGNAGRAKDLLAELLPIMERVFGTEHPTTVATRNNLAIWAEKAESWRRRAGRTTKRWRDGPDRKRWSS